MAMDVENNSAGAIAGYTAAAVAQAAAGKAINLMTAKAVLYVRLLGAGSIDTSGAAVSQDISALRSLRKTRKKMSTKIAERAGKMVTKDEIAKTAASVKMSEAEIAAKMMATGFLPMVVQYNPASLRMNTVGGKIEVYKTMGNDSMNSIQSTDKKTSTYLTVQLIFEDVNVSDAFGATTLSDQGGLNVSGGLDMAQSIAANTLGDGYSVKKQAEGIMSLLMMKATRQIIFVWNHLFFHGELISVDINYTMFNKLGHPIKATVDMQIQQTNGNAAFESDLAYWNEVFDQAFTQDTLISSLLG